MKKLGIVFLVLFSLMLCGCKKNPTSIECSLDLQMTLGDKQEVRCLVKPDKADQTCSIIIGDESILSLDKTGGTPVLVASKIGKTTVRIQAISDELIFKEFEITVILPKATDIVVEEYSSECLVNKRFQIIAKVIPSSAEQTLIYSSLNPNIASVDEMGNVFCIKEGEVTISMETLDKSVKKTITFKVIEPDTTKPKFWFDEGFISNKTINYNEAFNELEGIHATDEVDGDVTNLIEVTGIVDVKKCGTYDLIYKALDKSGNYVTFNRKIEVIYNYGVEFIGHAGSYYGIMNSEEAFLNACKKCTYQLLECDLRQTSDGVFVLCHDETFGGVTIASTTYDKIKDVEETKNRGGVSYTTKICTLKRYLEICKTYNKIGVIEVKYSNGINNNDQSRMKDFLDFVKSVGMDRQIILLGSQYKCLEWTRNNGYEYIPCQYLVKSIESEDTLKRCLENDFDISFSIDDSNSEEWIKRYKDYNIKVASYTFSQYKTKIDLQKWINLGVDYVTCDLLQPYEVVLPKKEVDTTDYFTVTFKDYDGTILKTSKVKAKHNAVSPLSPNREGYTFLGWDNSLENIVEDTTFTAQYELSVYKILYNSNLSIREEVEFPTRKAFIELFYQDFFDWLKTNCNTILGLTSATTNDVTTYSYVVGSTTATFTDVNSLINVDKYIFEKTLSGLIYAPTSRTTDAAVVPIVNESYFLNSSKYRDKYINMDEYFLACAVSYSYDTNYKRNSSGKIQVMFRFQQWCQGSMKDEAYSAIASLNTLPIVYNLKSVETTNLVMPKNSTYTILQEVVLEAPTCDGYTFLGWYLDYQGTSDKITVIPLGSTKDYTLFAKWEKNA